MRLFAFRLDVNGKAGARYDVPYGIFKAVANIMRLPHRHDGGNDDVKIDEGGRTGAAGSESCTR